MNNEYNLRLLCIAFVLFLHSTGSESAENPWQPFLLLGVYFLAWLSDWWVTRKTE